MQERTTREKTVPERTIHISRRTMRATETIQDVETLCGHISLNIRCMNHQDFQRGAIPENEVCFHCRQAARAYPDGIAS